jgi:hypothetical protein
VDAAVCESGNQTSPLKLVFDGSTARRPNSFRVGKVSATSVSPAIHEVYMISQPYAAARF